MGKTNKYNQYGKDIDNAVKQGLSSGDWSKVGPAITNSVNGAIDDVGEQIRKIGDIDIAANAKNLSSYVGGYSEGAYTRQRQEKLEREKRERERQRAELRKREEEKRERERQLAVQKAGKKKPLVPMKRIGGYSSTLYMVGGGVGLGITAFSVLGSLPALITGSVSLTGLIAGGVFAVIFAGLLRKGVSDSKRLSLAERYASICGNKGYIEIEELCNSTGRSRKQIIRDVKKLLKMGYFPQGRLDEGNKTLIFTDSVYEQYLETKRNLEVARNESIIDTSAREVPKTDLSREQQSELDQMIREGNEYIYKLHELNEKIPGEIITAKLTRLESLLKDIFTRVREHPEQMPKMHELMDYYLPTMLKLVTAYEEYDKVTEPGKDIVDAKKDIEGTLDTINAAFAKLLSNLFKDSVWDVTTDAQVLKTMLAQKGLSDGREGE